VATLGCIHLSVVEAVNCCGIASLQAQGGILSETVDNVLSSGFSGWKRKRACLVLVDQVLSARIGGVYDEMV